MKIIALFAALAVCFLSSFAQAGVINGDFQTGDFSDWAPVPDPSSIGASVLETSLSPPLYVASITNGDFSMSQAISTNPGQQYLVSFDLFGFQACGIVSPPPPPGTCPDCCPNGGGVSGIHVNDYFDENDLTARFGDGEAFIANLDCFADNGSCGGQFNFTGVASDFSTLLTFDFDQFVLGDPTEIGPLTFGNITVTSFDGPSSSNTTYIFPNPFTIDDVPEPMTLSLFGAGLVGAAAMRRRKKKVA